MKIGVYYDLPFGGAHVALEEIISRLQKKHQVTIYHNQNSTFSNLPFRRLWLDLESTLFQRFKQYQQAKEIDSEGFDVVLVSHDRHFQAPWVLRYLKTSTVFLCQEPTRAFFEEFLKIDPKLPYLNRLYEWLNRSIRKTIEVKNASFATKVISNSVYSSESIFRAYGVVSTPILLGFNPLNFFPKNVKRLDQVVVVGNDEPQKALPFAIECVSLVKKSVRPKMVIVSPRPGSTSLLVRLARKKGVSLTVFQAVPTSRLRQIYNQSKLSLAVAHLEPFGLSVVESLACGTPVVAINEAGYREIVSDLKTGLLVPRDPGKVAQALEFLLEKDQQRLKMGKFGLSDVTKRFSWDKATDKVEKIIYETT